MKRKIAAAILAASLLTAPAASANSNSSYSAPCRIRFAGQVDRGRQFICVGSYFRRSCFMVQVSSRAFRLWERRTCEFSDDGQVLSF